MFVRLVILVAIIKMLNGIKDDLKCPFGEGGWKTGEKIFNCKEGHGLIYHCLLDISGNPLEACMKRKRYQRNGCPWIFQRDVNYFLGEPLTPCQNRQYCPSKGKRFYSNELYLYPACLVKIEERWNFTLPDLNSSSTRNSTHQKNKRDEILYERILLPVLALYVSSMIIQIIISLYCKNKKPKDHKTVIDFEGRKRLLHEKNKEEEKMQQFSTPLAHIVTTSPTSDRNDEESSEESDALSSTADFFHWKCSSSISFEVKGSYLLEKCYEYVNGGVEEGLKEIFEDEIGKLKQGCNPRITTDDLKNVIALWVKKYDKPDLLTTAIELLSVLDNNCCLENLELIPDSYETPISLLLYSGRMEKERITEYLLKRLKHIDDEDKEQKTILHYCVYMDSKDLAGKVIEKDRSILDKRNIDGKSAFTLAMNLRKPTIAEFLFETGANVEDENFSTETALEKCLSHKWTNLLEKLLYKIKGENPEKPKLGKTFRTFLISCNKANLYLIDVALDIFPDMLSDVDYYLGDHPFIWALKVKRKVASQYILERMSNDELYSAEDCSGLSALHVSIKSRSLVRKVLRKDKNNMILNKTDRQNNTPIMYAAQCKSQLYFSVLLDQPGLSFLNININGKNILHIVVENNWYGKCEEILRGRDSKGNKRINEGCKTTLLKGQDKYGMTPLMYAVSNFHDMELIQLLVDEGSELVQMDNGRKTVFHHLVDIYSENIVATWTECTRVLMRSEKYRKTNYLFKVKDSNGLSLSDIALNKGCLHLLKTVDGEVPE